MIDSASSHHHRNTPYLTLQSFQWYNLVLDFFFFFRFFFLFLLLSNIYYYRHLSSNHITNLSYQIVLTNYQNKAVLEPRVSPAFAITYFCNHCNIILDLKIHQSMWIHWPFFPKTWTKGHWPLDDLWPHICWDHMCDSTQGSLCPSPIGIYQWMWIQWSILQITIHATYYIHTYILRTEWVIT